jgi:hypothetical protein
VNPSEQDKENYKSFFESLSNVLPCESCRESYKKMINRDPTRLTYDVMKNRETLTRWVYDIHHTVNRKLCVHYDISYNDVVNKFESFRVKCEPGHQDCVMPIEQRKLSYCNEYKREYPIVPFKVVKIFEPYANKRGILFNNLDKINLLYSNKIKNDEWDNRNKTCEEIVKKMRQEGITALEQEGEFKGLPTLNELLLLNNMASSMNLKEFVKPAKILGFQIKKMFRFSN